MDTMKDNTLLIIGAIVIGLLISWQTGLLTLFVAFYEEPYQQLTYTTGLDCNPRLQDCTYEGTLTGPEDASSVTFQTGFHGGGGRLGENCPSYKVEWEIYNYDTGNYETLTSIDEYVPSGYELYFIKQSSEPIKIFGGDSSSMTEYYACPEGTSSTDGICIYPGECIKKSYGNPTKYCVREKFTKGESYINNGIVKFRTTLRQIAEGCRGGKWMEADDYVYPYEIAVGLSEWTTQPSIISFDELINYANEWINGKITFDELINYANAWISS